MKRLIKFREIYKSGGLKAVLKVYSWKFIAGVFVYYLLRDSLMYGLLPYLLLKN